MHRTRRAFSFDAVVLALVVAAAAPSTAVAQVWDLAAFGGDSDAACKANGVTVDPPPFALTPGLAGHDLGTFNQAGCKDDFSQCHTSGSGGVQMFVDGIGTRCVDVRWDAIAQAQHACRCPPAPVAFDGEGSGSLTATLTLVPAGLPDGDPVTVFWYWSQVTTNNYDNPDGAPDVSVAQFGTLSLGGTDLFNGDFDMVNLRGWLSGTDTGSFPSTIGSPIGVFKGFGLAVNMEPLPEVVCGFVEDDGELVSYAGILRACLAGPPPPLQDPNGRIEFSTDMGSDASLADVPAFEGDEVFDPGDMYRLFDTVALPPMGADGLKDDLAITPTISDPAPEAPGAPIADACSGLDVGTQQGLNLDVDGSDTLDAATADMLEGALAAGPLASPVAMSPTECVRRAEFLLISYDDDGPTHVYAGVCEAPAADGSPIGETYGSVLNQDEVLELDLIPGPPPVLGVPFPVADEATSHASMGPDPVRVMPTSAADQVHDDDVDALDETRDACDTWLYSPDHEARIGRLAANIHRVTPAGDVVLVSNDHLGLSPTTDVRDFEFAVTTEPGTGIDRLTVLFSVSPDDPGTFGDESQGLDPGMIYYSYMTGSFHPYLEESLADAIDALTTLPAPLPAPPSDADGDGVLNTSDCAPMDGSAWSAPTTPVRNIGTDVLAVNRVVSWSPLADPGGTVFLYDGFRASTSTPGVFPASFPCFSNDVAGTSFADNTAFPRGTARLYVVRPQNACGMGPAGLTAGGLTPVVLGCP